MKERARTFKFKDFQKLLHGNGYRIVRIHGDHYIFHNGEKHISVNKHLNKMVARRLIKEYNLVA